MQVQKILGRDRGLERAESFMSQWEVMALGERELRFRARGQTLTIEALSDVMERASRAASGRGTRFVFDLELVDALDSCCSVLCAMFIRFARRTSAECRIVGLDPRLAAIMRFFFRYCGEIELVAAERRPQRAEATAA